RIARNLRINRVGKKTNQKRGRRLRQSLLCQSAHDSVIASSEFADFARSKTRGECVRQLIYAREVVKTMRACDQLGEDLCRLRLGLKDEGGGVCHVSQFFSLLRIQRHADFKRALVQRRQQPAPPPIDRGVITQTSP